MKAHVEVRGLTKSFGVRGAKAQVHAVNDVSFSIKRGKTLGLVGESGSGKSTIGRCLLRLTDATAGEVVIGGADIGQLSKRELRRQRSRMQMVFQDPYESLNPRMRIGATLEEPLRLHGVDSSSARMARCVELMDMVRLDAAFLNRFPNELSGGQLQRVGIARALATNPEFLVLDEPTSSLDLSVRAGILDLLEVLRDELEITCLFISHDLATVARMSDDVATLYLGKVVEIGPAKQVLETPQHPYTQALLSAALPIYAGSDGVRRHVLTGESPSPLELPAGCVFSGRCPLVRDDCLSAQPPLISDSEDHLVACVRVADGSNILYRSPDPGGPPAEAGAS